MKRSRRLLLANGLSFALLWLLSPAAGLAQIFPPTYPPSICPARIVSPANHAVFSAPVDIPIFAYAGGLYNRILFPPYSLYNAVTNVDFFAGTNDLGPGQALFYPFAYPKWPTPVPNQWLLVWTNPPPGAYALTAVAKTDRGLSLTSAPVNITVVAPPPNVNLPDTVSIAATDPVAIEGTNYWIWRGLTNATPSWTNWPPVVWHWFTNYGPKNATFTVRRFGDVSADVTVNYRVGGTASNGVDYAALPGSITIPAGRAYALLNVVPIDDGATETNKTVVLTLTPSTNSPPDYLLGLPRSAAALIIDSTAPRPGTSLVRGASFHLNASGPDGAWFSVHSSTNLVDWLPICTNQVVGGMIDFVDPDAATQPNRFYRVLPETGPGN